MAWAAGAFTRIGGSTHWVDDKNAAINIVASRHDTNDEDLASGINFCLNRDGSSKPTADFLPSSDNTQNLGSGAFRWASFNGVSASILTPLQASKPATTVRTSTIVPAIDPDLQITVPSAGTYIVEMLLGVWGTSASVQGFRFALGATGTAFGFTTVGVNINWSVIVGGANNGVILPTSTPTAIFTTFTDVGATIQGSQVIHAVGSFVATSITAATLALYWAQNSSSVNAVNVGAGSFLTLRRIA